MRAALRVPKSEEAKFALTDDEWLLNLLDDFAELEQDRHDFGVKAPSYRVLKRNCMGVGTVGKPCWGPVEWSKKYERPLCQGHNEPGYKEEGPCL